MCTTLELARAEAMFLSNTSRQYVTPKDGSPLRGLMQDHVCGGTLMAKRYVLSQLVFALRVVYLVVAQGLVYSI